MAKSRKLHQLSGVIKYCGPGISKSKQGKDQPFYCLNIEQASLFTDKKETSIYVFANLVNAEIGTTLEQQAFKNKKYLFWCEKRVRGGRLKDGTELPDN